MNAQPFASARSNYFGVTNVEAFTARMEILWLEVLPGVGSQEGLFALSPDPNSDGAWPSVYYDPADPDVDVEFDVAEEVSAFLADGHVAIFMSCGAEGLSLIDGTASAINGKGERVHITLSDIYAQAKVLGDRITDATYW